MFKSSFYNPYLLDCEAKSSSENFLKQALINWFLAFEFHTSRTVKNDKISAGAYWNNPMKIHKHIDHEKSSQVNPKRHTPTAFRNTNRLNLSLTNTNITNIMSL